MCRLRYASLTRSHSNTLSHSVDSKSCDQITSKSRRKSNVVSVYLLDLYMSSNWFDGDQVACLFWEILFVGKLFPFCHLALPVVINSGVEEVS